jgi:hypothetical protein
MRIVKQDREHFRGTHKGYEIEIQREHDAGDHHFYIWVRSLESGMYAYDGYCPEGITTFAAAKKEAIRGACLDKPLRIDDLGQSTGT